jgi:hypothetical protein
MIWLALLGCPKTPEGAAGPSVTPTAEFDARPEGERMRSVLDDSNAAMAVCYESALARNPQVYGDVTLVVRVSLDGTVDQVETEFSTLGDTGLEDCVLGQVAALQFPVPSRDGLSLRYAYLFTSPNTPAEVSRALQLKHGLITLEGEAAELEARGEERNPPPPVGWVESW